MTIRDLYREAEKYGALDFELHMNCNLEPMLVRNVLIIPDMQLGDIVLKNIIVLDN